MATQLPNVQSSSYENILGDLIQSFVQKTNINDLRVGSLSLSLLEATALTVARTQGDIFQILKDQSVDYATGEALQRLAADENITPIPARAAYGSVTFTDTTFNKISTKIYAGTQAPVVGATTIFVSDATDFTNTGTVYIGRGTDNIEQVAYTAKTNLGSYWSLTLATPTARYHNINETVILAQGGVRSIPQGTVVQIPATGANTAVSYTTTAQAFILDGEVVVENVPVLADEVGSNGNAIIDTITGLDSPPFSGATVSNPLPFTTGRDAETDAELKVRIKRKRLSTGLGTSLAIKSAVIGAQSPDEPASITSAEITQNQANDTILYVDDGSGYEPTSQGVGYEPIVDAALGGETNFQLQTGGNQTSVTKAYLVSANIAPFDVTGNDRLSISVGGVVTEHIFQTTDFQSPGSATAYEIAASVNADATLDWEAFPLNGAKQIAFQAKTNTNETIQTTDVQAGRNAADQLALPSKAIETLRLFKNNVQLSKDGSEAFLFSNQQSLWSNTITTGDTLIIAVDNTAAITYTFTNQDFINEGTYPTVSSSNSLESWANVINAKITGVTASVVGSKLKLVSNKGESSAAALNIDQTSTLVTKAAFSLSEGLEADGVNSDYELSRNTAQIRLQTPLSAGDSLSAGVQDTEATIFGDAISGGSLTLTSTATFWVIADDKNARVLTTSVVTGSTIQVSNPSGNTVRYTSSNSNAFANVSVGDYVIVWSADFLNASNRLEGRVFATSSTTLDIVVTAAEAAAIVPETVLYNSGFVVISTVNVPQKFSIAAGTYTVPAIKTLLDEQGTTTEFYTFNNDQLLISSPTKTTEGAILVPTVNTAALALNLPTGQIAISSDSLIAFYESDYTESQFPSFIDAPVTAGVSGDPTGEPITGAIATISAVIPSTTDPDKTVVSLNPYQTQEDALQFNESTELNDFGVSTLDVKPDYFFKRFRIGDRLFLAEPMKVAANDNLNVILNNDSSNQLFSFNLYRRLTTLSTFGVNTTQFNALDLDNNSSALTDFFTGFDFANFGILMQAKEVLTGSTAGNESSLLYRSVAWGRSGERMTIGYIYPTVANQTLAFVASQSDDTFDIRIVLQSGAAIATSIDNTTEWDVTITPNTPVAGVDQVTYTYSGTGTAPALSLSGGEYVNIAASTGFDPANQGVYRVSDEVGFLPTATSFTVVQPNGVAVIESNISTLANNGIIFYSAAATTAADIDTYVNANLDLAITSEIVDDGGTTGSGVIDKSTYENSDFAYTGLQLKDGQNWVESFSASVAPNFTLKRPLTLASAIGYEFQQSEQIRLVPSSVEQMARFLNVAAVSALSLAGSVKLANQDGKLQFATSTVGSGGAIQIVGSPGNSLSSPLISSSILLGDHMQSFMSSPNLIGLVSDQYVKLQASLNQSKNTDFDAAGSITVTPNSPSVGKTRVKVSGQTIGELYFGSPRPYVRTLGRSFKIEKQGNFVCLSWNGVGTTPSFADSAIEINAGVGTYTITQSSQGIAQLQILTGPVTFASVQPGDILTSTLTNNSGTFQIISVSPNGDIIQYLDSDITPEAAQAYGALNFAVSGTIEEGDNITLSTPFNVLNQGKFRVIRSVSDTTKAEVWFENELAVEEYITDTIDAVNIGYDATTVFQITNTNNEMLVTITGGTVPDLDLLRPADEITFGPLFNAANQGPFQVKSVDIVANSIVLVNPLTVTESVTAVPVSGGNALVIHRPCLFSTQYDATSAGDQLIITSSFLGANNQDTFTVEEVLSPSEIVVSELMVSAGPTVLGSNQPNVLIQEEFTYQGYKKIYSIVADPQSTTTGIVVFDTYQQYDKVNSSAQITLTTLNKPNFPTNIANGLDAYRYDTGLIGEANRIVYGSSRDPATYPGVAAAGAEIFIRGPLIRLVEVSIDIRIQTGVPFLQLATQVRQNVSALVNSNPIGQSIAISDIVSVVNSIPGVTAVAISSPLYNASNDSISVTPAEKTLILNPLTNIQVDSIT